MRVMLTLAILACATLAASLIPSPYSIERPGPVVNTLGEIETNDATADDGPTRVIDISDAQTYPTSGELNLLTVSIYGTPQYPASWLSLVPALFDPSQRIAPRAEFFPEGVSQEDRDSVNAVLMDNSQLQSAVAAYHELGVVVPVNLTVADISPDGPADEVLKTNDRIVASGGVVVNNLTELRVAVAESGAGTPLALTIERDGAEQEVSVTPQLPEGGEEPMMGVSIASDYQFPADIDITLSEIGGPSAGMIFAIAIYDELTEGALLDGATVSGTGTVSEAGDVGAIGGLTQKMWAAARADSALFLMPMDNCDDLPDRVPGDMQIVPVDTLAEAISAIETYAAGDTPAGLERCGSSR